MSLDMNDCYTRVYTKLYLAGFQTSKFVRVFNCLTKIINNDSPNSNHCDKSASEKKFLGQRKQKCIHAEYFKNATLFSNNNGHHVYIGVMIYLSLMRKQKF